ncbi:hypothetical protein MKK49_11435 [Methylobacterium sp. J-090]|nr:hypothetical protein [Methylobacterium sp. J-090]MCJ2081870.1 hypothetical protein [Methylobacterium sp. J-090]
MLIAVPAFAQGGPPRQPGVIVQNETNTTGNDGNIVISRGATGADTITTNSAAGGNASRPEQAFPNGSANGGGGGGR